MKAPKYLDPLRSMDWVRSDSEPKPEVCELCRKNSKDDGRYCDDCRSKA